MPAPFVFIAVVVVTMALVIFFGAWAVAADAEGRPLTFGVAPTTTQDSLQTGSTEGGADARAAFGVAPIGETESGASGTWWGQGFLKACPLH